MSSVAAVLAVCSTLLLDPATPVSSRDTTVYLSDIHMNVDSGYSWLVDHADELTTFLTEVNGRQDVSELVILGDLVDDWVVPVDSMPQTFSEVLTASTNGPIVAALQAVCANPNIKVTYVVGNHDMLSFEADNRAVLSATFPGMEIISDSPGLGAYSRDGVIWAEHGHRYCLFNAPDTWSRASGHLPMGYFISRMAASKSVSSGQVVTSPDVLDEYVNAPGASADGSFSDLLIAAIFDGIAVWSGTSLLDSFYMNGKDGYTPDPSVASVGFTYDSIFSGWPSRQDRVSNVDAVWNDVGHLSSAANLLFEMPDYLKDKYPFTPRIILFGHTHQAAFQYHTGETTATDSIYVNTGTWIDSKPMTWVEIETSDGLEGDRDYQVSLWYYGETAPRQTAGITAVPSP